MRVRGQRWRFYRDAGRGMGLGLGQRRQSGSARQLLGRMRKRLWAGLGFFLKPKQIQFKFKFEEFEFKLNGKQ